MRSFTVLLVFLLPIAVPAQFEHQGPRPFFASGNPDTLRVTERYKQYQLVWHTEQYMSLFDSLKNKWYALPYGDGNTTDYPFKFHFDNGFIRIKYGDMKTVCDLKGKVLLSRAHNYHFHDSLLIGFICSTGWYVLDRKGDTLAFQLAREEYSPPDFVYTPADTFWAPKYERKNNQYVYGEWIQLTSSGKIIAKSKTPPGSLKKGGYACMNRSNSSYYPGLLLDECAGIETAFNYFLRERLKRKARNPEPQAKVRTCSGKRGPSGTRPNHSTKKDEKGTEHFDDDCVVQHWLCQK